MFQSKMFLGSPVPSAAGIPIPYVSLMRLPASTVVRALSQASGHDLETVYLCFFLSLLSNFEARIHENGGHGLKTFWSEPEGDISQSHVNGSTGTLLHHAVTHSSQKYSGTLVFIIHVVSASCLDLFRVPSLLSILIIVFNINCKGCEKSFLKP